MAGTILNIVMALSIHSFVEMEIYYINEEIKYTCGRRCYSCYVWIEFTRLETT